MDNNVKSGWLTGLAGGKCPWVRHMDNLGYYGHQNYIDATDIPPPVRFGWAGAAIPAAAPGSTTDPNGATILSGTNYWKYRAYNTNPSDGTYSWSSPNIYSSQWGLTGSDGFGAYLAVGPTDNGNFLSNVNQAAAYGTVAIELVSYDPTGTILTPHNLKSGQFIQMDSSGGSGSGIPARSGSATGTASLTNAVCFVFATGIHTVLVSIGSGINSGGSPGIARVDSAAAANLFYFAGTATTVNGSAAIVGSGSTFNTQIAPGQWLFFGTDTASYQVLFGDRRHAPDPGLELWRHGRKRGPVRQHPVLDAPGPLRRRIPLRVCGIRMLPGRRESAPESRRDDERRVLDGRRERDPIEPDAGPEMPDRIEE